MKKTFLILSLILIGNQISYAQKLFSISGQVFSAISEMPVHRPDIRMRVDSLMEKLVFLNEKGEFKITGLSKGKHKLFLDTPFDELRQHYYPRFDTLIILNGSISNINIILQCPDCNCWGSDRNGAINDIKRGKIKLFVSPVGISGLMEPQPNDDEFQKKYAVHYGAFGCSSPEYECIEGYNTIVFDYLDKKFGKKWRKEARTDVIYLLDRD